MSGSTISSSIDTPVVVGPGHYATPLTITAAGTVAPSGSTYYGATAVYAYGGGSIANAGVVVGANGGAATGDAGGIGVKLAGSSAVSNTGAITGGLGGTQANGMAGGTGGVGVALAASGTSFYNATLGVITGGAGGYSLTGAAGLGGVGVQLSAGSTGLISGTCFGGAGAQGGLASQGGTGGAGALVYGTLNTQGFLQGGNGGAGNGVTDNGAGTGGDGADLAGAGSLTNSYNVIGGTGGADSLPGGIGGNGGIGLRLGSLQSAYNIDHGFIIGGYAGYGARLSGTGGAGAALYGSAYLLNMGEIYGGSGRYSQGGTGSAGGAGVLLSGDASLVVASQYVIFGGEAGQSATGTNGTGGAGVVVSGNASLFISQNAAVGGGDSQAGPSGTAGSGGVGVYLNSGTLIVAGSVVGGGNTRGSYADAVQFGAGAGTLVLDPGAAFFGLVQANQAVADVLTLGGSAATTLGGLGSQITGFTTIRETSGASWTLNGTASFTSDIVLDGGTLTLADTGSSGTGTITFDPGVASTLAIDAAVAVGNMLAGFVTTDTIDLAAFQSSTITLTPQAGNVLDVADNQGAFIALDFSADINVQTANFATSADGNGGTQLSINTCFLRGTRLLTDRGEVAVEALRAGDHAMVHGPAGPVRKRIKWHGVSQCEAARHPRPQDMFPVRVRAGALADLVPHRDLLVSPDHALFIDGVLIAARFLLNGASIRQEAMASVDYHHVEFDSHELVLAEGALAESFLDAGNRAGFANGGAPLDTATRTRLRAGWAAKACARLAANQPERAAIHRRLLDRALRLGYQTTTDADLRLQAGGKPIRPATTPDGLVFLLPPRTQIVRLVSRAAVPSHSGEPHQDGRMLGVGVLNLALDDTSLARDDARLLSGWHAPEPSLRWTDGNAGLRTEGASKLTLRLHAGHIYWLETAHGARQAA